MAGSAGKHRSCPRATSRLGWSQAGVWQGADSGIYRARLEVVLGIAPLPTTAFPAGCRMGNR